MKIAIFGLGYVGLTAAGCLVKEGHHVVGIEPNAEKVKQIRTGHSPIFEPGLDDLLSKGIQDGLLLAEQSASGLLDDADVAIVCVGTPSGPDGSHNMSYIAEVSRQIAAEVGASSRSRPLTVAYRSTFRPGTIEELVYPIFKSALKARIGDVELVYNPEFLRESVAIKDYFSPPKIVIGTKDGLPSENMEALHANISAPTFYTGYREAEITKFVDNSFHALKVAFANEIGRVCVKLNVSAKKVHEIFVSDTKLNISPYYMRPGGAFGGSCLPKDVRALSYIADEVGAYALTIDSLLRTNEVHKRFLFEYSTAGVPAGGRILMLGLAFKADSDDLRESPNVDLARRIAQAGFSLSIYDPAIDPAKLLGANLGYTYAQLPDISDLLVSKDVAENERFDVVVDTNGSSARLSLGERRVVDLNSLP